MRYKSLVLAVIAFAGTTTAAFADRETTNGGDGVHCTASENNPFDGVYSLDYVLTYNYETKNKDIEIRTWDQMRTRLIYLGNLLSKWRQPITDFLATTKNTTDYQKPIIWLPGAALEPINDENLTRRLPDNCGEVVQMVRREARKSGLIAFEYNAPEMQKLTQSSLQESFLLTHELLWSFSADVRAIYETNRFLHSNRFGHLSQEELLKTFVRIGLISESELPSHARADKLEVLEGIVADDITSVDTFLAKGGSLDFSVTREFCDQNPCSSQLNAVINDTGAIKNHDGSFKMVVEYTPLTVALFARPQNEGFSPMAKTLIEKGLSFRNESQKVSSTATQEIVNTPSDDGSGTSVRVGTITYITTDRGRFTLLWALIKDRLDVAELFFANRSDLSNEHHAVAIAADMKNPALADRLLRAGAPPLGK